MPGARPSKSGYARIQQAEEEEEEEDYTDNYEDDDTQRTPISLSNSYYAPIQPGRHDRMSARAGSSNRVPNFNGHKRGRSSSTVDIKAINARLEKWADEIASKLKIKKIKGKSAEDESLDIHYSVFQAPDDIRPATAEQLAERASQQNLMTKSQFDDIVESVRVAQEQGIELKLVTQGSSGSYFAKDTSGRTVGIFKPKDEEPYANKNPKWTKWIHRNLFPFFFGRACLIPNLSYVSEAAAYVLDTRLETNLVPPTDVVWLSSPSFNYDFWDRRAFYRKKKPLPPKAGSFQVFLKGFKDATQFLKEYPWPDQANPSIIAPADLRKKKGWTDDCRLGAAAESEDEDADYEQVPGAETRRRREFWSPALQQSFREELEKLVILDYIMRNTDRGLDNWMIRVDADGEQASIVAAVPKDESRTSKKNGNLDEPYTRKDSMTTNASDSGTGRSTPRNKTQSRALVGAIDNSLAWPWKHPDAWRSFPFGWLFLPVSLIGQPFSENTRKHFLPLLTSKQWWSETQVALRNCFSQDEAFNERMYARQIAVMKGQAFNVVETLKDRSHGPLELTRRTRVCVWDDLQEIPTVVPLRPSTDDARKSHDREAMKHAHEREELDIGASRELPTDPASAAFPFPSGEGIKPSLFNTSREHSREDENIPAANASEAADLGHKPVISITTPPAKSPGRRPPNKARMSYDEPRRPWMTDSRKRNLSFTAKPWQDDEESDGDLGYAVTEDMESYTKKVIVERLETVKTSNPVFTWC